MTTVKVFLGGEGKNDIGTRGQTWGRDPELERDAPGVLEVLLRKVRPSGWKVDGAMEWKAIRKYRAGAATQREDHADAHNVRVLIQRACEQGCEVLAFVRDADDDTSRTKAIRKVLADLSNEKVAAEYGYPLDIVGGVAVPTLEAWILHLHGVAGTDAMSKAGASRKLAEHNIALKSSADFVAIAEACEQLPNGTGSLCEWLDRAREVFARLLDGVP